MLTLIVGGDGVSYGARPKDAQHWRDKMLAEVGSQLDPTRTHFLGKLPYADYQRVLQVSAAHAYLTYPFVLSWSALEAMACGANLVAGDTAPVREVVQHGRNGLLVPPLNTQAVAAQLLHTLAEPEAAQLRGQRARQEVTQHYSRSAGLRALTGFCKSAPPPAPPLQALAHPPCPPRLWHKACEMTLFKSTTLLTVPGTTSPGRYRHAA